MTRIAIACSFYAAMAVIGLLLMLWRLGAAETVAVLFAPPQQWAGPIGFIVLATAATHWSSRFLAARWDSVARSAYEIRRYLGGLTHRDIAFLALFSGIGEELLFRGWLLNETGLIFSSVLFGLAHVPLNRDWLFWPVFAFAMGLVLGWLYLWSGHLLWPILLHAAINYWNLRYFLREDTAKCRKS